MTSLLLPYRTVDQVAVFTVHEPPGALDDRLARAESMVFVADGFSWGAALLTPFWLAAHQLWVALAAYVAALAAVTAALGALGVSELGISLVIMALNVWIGFEAADLQRLALADAGWRDAGSVSGRNLSECERRFFDGWLSGQAERTVTTDTGSTPPRTGNGTILAWTGSAAFATLISRLRSGWA